MSYYTVPYLFTDRYTNSPFRRILPFYIHYQFFVGKGFSPAVCCLKILPSLNAWKSFHSESAFLFLQIFLLCSSTYPHHTAFPDYRSLKTTEKKRPQFLVTLVHQADNLALPFALLEANTFLPPGVLILARKP